MFYGAKFTRPNLALATYFGLYARYRLAVYLRRRGPAYPQTFACILIVYEFFCIWHNAKKGAMLRLWIYFKV